MTIPTDKTLHVLSCYSIALTTGTFAEWWIAFTATTLIGIGKEIYDKVTGRGTPEWLDLLADVIGAALGTAAAVICACCR